MPPTRLTGFPYMHHMIPVITYQSGLKYDENTNTLQP